MAVALGLGVLAKGPVGAILPGASILIFMIVERRGRQILTMLDPGAIILGAAIASSWYLACYFGGRFAFLNRQLDTENVGRFFGSLGAMAPWYYLKPVLLNSAPLSLLVPIAAAYRITHSIPPGEVAKRQATRVRALAPPQPLTRAPAPPSASSRSSTSPPSSSSTSPPTSAARICSPYGPPPP